MRTLARRPPWTARRVPWPARHTRRTPAPASRHAPAHTPINSSIQPNTVQHPTGPPTSVLVGGGKHSIFAKISFCTMPTLTESHCATRGDTKNRPPRPREYRLYHCTTPNAPTFFYMFKQKRKKKYWPHTLVHPAPRHTPPPRGSNRGFPCRPPLRPSVVQGIAKALHCKMGNLGTLGGMDTPPETGKPFSFQYPPSRPATPLFRGVGQGKHWDRVCRQGRPHRNPQPPQGGGVSYPEPEARSWKAAPPTAAPTVETPPITIPIIAIRRLSPCLALSMLFCRSRSNCARR